MDYYSIQKAKNIQLIKHESSIFNGDCGGGLYNKTPYEHILSKLENNFYKSSFKYIDNYRKSNSIDLHKAIGHTTSSQAFCLNHLFPIRDNEELVLYMINYITNRKFKKVLPIIIDSDKKYISFEVSSKNDYLKEETTLRGFQNTSIDAVILAEEELEEEQVKTVLIVMEWKYTEPYLNIDNSTDAKKGQIRLNRYSDLINSSTQLKVKSDEYTNSIYFFGELYQLMRQTLWAEQMILNKDKEDIQADDFLHLFICPTANKSMLSNMYPQSNQNLEATWRNLINDNSKFMIIDPVIIKDSYLYLANYDYQFIKDNNIAIENHLKDLSLYLEERYYK